MGTTTYPNCPCCKGSNSGSGSSSDSRKRCVWQFTSTYTCGSGWSDVELFNVQCMFAPTGSGWQLSSSFDGGCIYVKFVVTDYCSGEVYNTDGCVQPATPAAPTFVPSCCGGSGGGGGSLHSASSGNNSGSSSSAANTCTGDYSRPCLLVTGPHGISITMYAGAFGSSNYGGNPMSEEVGEDGVAYLGYDTVNCRWEIDVNYLYPNNDSGTYYNDVGYLYQDSPVGAYSDGWTVTGPCPSGGGGDDDEMAVRHSLLVTPKTEQIVPPKKPTAKPHCVPCSRAKRNQK